jgi:hypothetical protein
MRCGPRVVCNTPRQSVDRRSLPVGCLELACWPSQTAVQPVSSGSKHFGPTDPNPLSDVEQMSGLDLHRRSMFGDVERGRGSTVLQPATMHGRQAISNSDGTGLRAIYRIPVITPLVAYGSSWGRVDSESCGVDS